MPLEQSKIILTARKFGQLSREFAAQGVGNRLKQKRLAE
jgi:hypothetical protein